MLFTYLTTLKKEKHSNVKNILNLTTLSGSLQSKTATTFPGLLCSSIEDGVKVIEGASLIFNT